MTLAKATGPKGKADKLFSKIIRRPGACANCDYVCPPSCNAGEGIHASSRFCKLQCAHIVSRTYSATRCDTANALPLCAKCHYFFTAWPLEFAQFVLDTVGAETYAGLKRLAQKGGRSINWDREVERLELLWSERREWYF